MLSVIMAGGVGERFWPLSRRRRPKQLLDLTGRGSMIDLTLSRVSELSKPEEIFVLTSVEQLDAILQEIGDVIPRDNVIAEPVGRNTAPSVGLAALVISSRVGDEPFIVLPADHVVGDADSYNATVKAAAAYAAANDSLVTFGITPTRPETGYGYIHDGRAVNDGEELFEVQSFHEKPSAEKAADYLKAGGYYWNSGMFVWRPSVILKAIERFVPELAGVLGRIESGVGTESLDEVLKLRYREAPSVSIDYGVMEKADNVVVASGNFYWNDVGNWESVREVYEEDGDGNVVVGDHVLIDTKNSTIFSSDCLVGAIGLDNVVIVKSKDAILVCKRDRVHEVRDIVQRLKKNKSELI